MKKDAKTFKKVAGQCSQFHPEESTTSSATNSTGSGSSSKVSCKNCTHYEPSRVCSLNLYQEILENHNF
ncbi:MAG: hypothetical protein IJ733_14780 [Lachnospiraceae bacterium]|nr:hypothetical protein [Lachnospiraceae bacterium]